MSTPASPSSPPATRRSFVLAGLVLAMFMSAIEGTIVATAMPNIAASLGGFSLYAWVFAGYLLMQAVTTPMFGKAADLVGRKPVFVVGVSIFLAASVACGFATSMPWLIAFRLLQGIGAGAVQPVTATLAGDLYAYHERARVQGWLSSVWGISALLGPLAGGLIVERFDWAWIFWANVPFGLVAIVAVTVFLHEDVDRRGRSIDGLGIATFTVATASALVVLTQAATLPVAASVGLAATSLAAFVGFFAHERRAPEPMIPPELWSDRLVRSANLATLGAGAVMIAVATYLPTYAQAVLGTSALVAGFTLTTMSMGWPIASVVAGHLLVRFGPRLVARAGSLALLAGSLAFVAMRPSFGAGYAAASSALVGVGMGLLSTTFIVSIQTRADWSKRGSATATNLLMRILGNALGAALLGGIVNASLLGWLQRNGLAETIRLDDVTRLIDGTAATADVPLEAIRAGMRQAIDGAFVAMAVAAALTVVLAFTIPALDPSEEAP